MDNKIKSAIAIACCCVTVAAVACGCAKSNKDKTIYNAEKNNKMINYEYLNKNYCEQGQTVLVGDSITEILNFNELFADYEQQSGLIVYDRGISGDTSNRLLERFESNVLNINPKNIVILIGTNDFNYGLSMDDTVNNIDAILSLIEEKCSGANVILQAVYPVNTELYTRDKKRNEKINELNVRVKGIADKHSITFLDLTAELSDLNGNLKADYTYDGLHPNVFGFEVVAEQVIPLLK